MYSAKDGSAINGGRHPGKGCLRLDSLKGRLIVLSLLCLTGMPIGVAADAQGPAVSTAVPVVPAVMALANQSARLDGEEPPAAPAAAKTAVANRPVTLQPEGGPSFVEEKPVGHFGPTDQPLSLAEVSVDDPDQVLLDGPAPVQPPASSQAAPAGAPPSPPQARPANQPGEDKMISMITAESEQARRIIVAKDSAVTIDLKVPVERVETRDPNIADVVRPTPQRIIVMGRAYGSTQIVLYAAQEQRVFNVIVEMNLGMLNDVIKSVAPTADVQLRSLNGTIVLQGSVPDAETARQIAEMAALVQGGEVRNQLKIAGVQQTMLRVVVAEVNRVALRELGVNWAVGGSDWSRDFFFANNIGQINPTTFTSSGVTNVLLGNKQGGQITYALGAAANGTNTNVTFGFPRAELQMFVNALRQNNLAKVLAEPNLVAISGQTAKFLVGGEVPIPVPQGGTAAGAITIEYHEFGVRLGFTPTVVGGQVVRLHVMTEVSEAIPGQQLIGGFPIFTFNTRRVESTIECGNGQTFAIAGLLSESVQATASKIPALGDLPILGSLFSSVNYQRSNTELVVLVTPQLVEPLDPQQVPPAPGSLVTEPNDYELFGLQKLEGTPAELPEHEGVPREHAPVNTWPGEAGSWSSSQTALRGPWGFAESTDAN